jgi:RNA polymerase sigma-70 factor (ECF subfamily)
MTRQQSIDDLDKLLRHLVQDAREGNAVSYKKLLEELAPFVRRNSVSVLVRYGQAAMTEDMTQEVLLAVHLKLHTYDENLSFIAWVRAVTKHKIIDGLRRNKISAYSIDEEGATELIDQVNPEIQTVRNDLFKLLSQLKPPAGDIIYALKVEGVTVRDLAAIYKTSESNIKVIVHRGLQKLSALVMNEKVA